MQKKKEKNSFSKNTFNFRSKKGEKFGGQGLRSSRMKGKRRTYWIKDLAQGNCNLQKKKKDYKTQIKK
jgi:hypothetical protein